MAVSLPSLQPFTWTILENVYEAEFLKQLRECALQEAGKICKKYRIPHRSDSIHKEGIVQTRGIKRFEIYLQSEIFSAARLLFPDPLTKLLQQVMDTDDFECSSVSMLRSYPGSSDQKPHCDAVELFGSIPSTTLPCYYLSVFIPLQPVTAANGPTDIGGIRTALQMNQVLVFDGRVTHFGTGNTSTEVNDKLMLVYKRPWFMDLNNDWTYAAVVD